MSNTLKVLRELASNQKYATKKDYARQCVARWKRSGLLEGLQKDANKESQVAMILENQLRHTLNESNTIGVGGGALSDNGVLADSKNIQGYTAIAFPMVRKIFGNTIANNVASIQTLNQPTGLIFYLDFVYGSNVGGDVETRGSNAGQSPDTSGPRPERDYKVATYARGQSMFGEPVAEAVRSGATRIGGQYDLAGSGFSKFHDHEAIINDGVVFAGAWDGTDWTEGAQIDDDSRNLELLGYDPQVIQLLEDNVPFFFMVVRNTGTPFLRFDLESPKDISLFYTTEGSTGQRHTAGAEVIPQGLVQASKGILNVRRLNQVGTWNDDTGWTPNPFSRPDDAGTDVLFVVHGTPDDGAFTPSVFGADAFKEYSADASKLGFSAILSSRFRTDLPTGATNLVPVGESDLGVDPRPLISEIDLKLGTEPVQVEARKYRVKWTDELATDVRAQLSLDVSELLSNHMADAIQMDIDREILDKMLTQASAARLFWSKQVGKYVNQRTGRQKTYDFSDDAAIPAVATANMSRPEWYSGLGEVINTAANEIHTRTKRGQANFIVVSPDVATILESSRIITTDFSMDAQGQVDFGSYTIGAQQIGTIQGRYKVFRCSDFPRNKILVGYKGQDDIDTGYVYCPYVPLVITPVLANTEDFQPRQAVYTRYAEKMIRADYFATITVLDMDMV